MKEMEGGWMEGGGVGRAGSLKEGMGGWSWMEGGWLEGGLDGGGVGWMEGWWMRAWTWTQGCRGGRLDGWRVGGLGWMGVKCGSVRAVRFCVSVQRFAVFAVHRGGRFLAFRFRFAVRFAAFLN